ncbi:MAG: phosphate transport system permease protein [Candidatus Peregrinibacteria bacterium Greene0416_19]|nr:MAG: phosphate transport system permease protein [Candidatus Peregrinibacteria bacterium Greene0416_19]
MEAVVTDHPQGEFRRRAADRAMHWILRIIASLTVVLLIGIFVFLLKSGLRTFSEVPILNFLFGTRWNPSSFHEPLWGILPLVTGTLFVSAGALLIAVPFGLSIAIYLSYIASRRTREILKPVIEMIAGIPSVVLGLIGLLYLAPLIAKTFGLSNGLNALNASILVAIATLPTIASLCEDALSGLSHRLSESSWALGATRWTTIRKVLVPAAAPGIGAAIMLGLGRAIGETMVVLMVAGNSLAFPRSFLEPVRPMTATIAIEIREVVVGDLHWNSLFAVGLVLFLITFAINSVTDLYLHRTIRS